MAEYKDRIIDATLDRQLAATGAVLIEGAKWCGKTSTAEQHAQSVLYMNDPNAQNVSLAQSSPSLALRGETPRLIDEWLLVPALWDAVRFEVDHREGPSQFILTGSATPVDSEQLHHSGIGRIARVLMRPMSLYESGDSNGDVSLKDLFDQKEPVAGSCTLDLDNVAFLACRGGWPQATNVGREEGLILAENYYAELIESDISKVDGIKRDSGTTARILRSYARHLGQQASLESLRADVSAGDGADLGIDTMRSYINALRSIFIIEDAPAWNPNLRSNTAIRTSDTRYFVDPSIAMAALGISPDGALADMHTFGFVFENLAVRDLRIYAQALSGRVSHYRDSNGVECDVVIHLKDGRYGLVQIKTGANDESLESGAKALKTFREKLDTEKMSEPSFMMILTGNAANAYQRQDGVYVVPIGCLKP